MNMCNTNVLYVFNNLPFEGFLFVSWKKNLIAAVCQGLHFVLFYIEGSQTYACLVYEFTVKRILQEAQMGLMYHLAISPQFGQNPFSRY